MTEYGEMFSAAVAAELRAQRARQQVTIDELTAASGMSRTSVLNYLNAKRDIPMVAFLDLCRALGADPRVIFAAAEDHVKQ